MKINKINYILIAFTLFLLLNGCSQKSTNPFNNNSFKFLTSKKEINKSYTSQIDYYYSPNKDWEKMNSFINRKANKSEIFYHAVFVDNPKFISPPKTPFTNLSFNKVQSKHIIAIFRYNPNTSKSTFTFYNKNYNDSIAKTLNK